MNPSTLRQLKQHRERFTAEKDRLEALDTHFREVITFFETTDEHHHLRRSSGEVMKDDLENILKAEGKSMHPTALLERLQAQGMTVPGQDPAHNLLSHMSSDPKGRFYPLGDHTWGLREWNRLMEEAPPEQLVHQTTAGTDLLEDTDSLPVSFTLHLASGSMKQESFAALMEGALCDEDLADFVRGDRQVEHENQRATISFEPQDGDESEEGRVRGYLTVTNEHGSSTAEGALWLDIQDKEGGRLVLAHTG